MYIANTIKSAFVCTVITVIAGITQHSLHTALISVNDKMRVAICSEIDRNGCVCIGVEGVEGDVCHQMER